jgi:hypothetical protein
MAAINHGCYYNISLIRSIKTRLLAASQLLLFFTSLSHHVEQGKFSPAFAVLDADLSQNPIAHRAAAGVKSARSLCDKCSIQLPKEPTIICVRPQGINAPCNRCKEKKVKCELVSTPPLLLLDCLLIP